MKRALHALVIGYALGALALGPALTLGSTVNSPINSPTNSTGEAAAGDAAPLLALISGTVKDEAGHPLAGAVVALLEAVFNGRELKSVKTDSEGKFTAEMLPGVYRLRAAADGFRPVVLARIELEQAARLTYDFALKRVDKLVDQRGDRDDYRWIGRSVPRHVLHLEDPDATVASAGEPADQVVDRSLEYRPSFHGMMQLVASSSAGGPDFYGTNFAVAGTLGGNFGMALIGQRGRGYLAPQRLEAIATLRPTNNHQVTASIGYGSVAYMRGGMPQIEGPILDGAFEGAGEAIQPNLSSPLRAGNAFANAGSLKRAGQIDQFSVSAVAEWQVFQPLLVIYGFDYARFVGSATSQRDSILPRFAFQYSPGARWRVNAALTPGARQARRSLESFDAEDIEASFDTQAAEAAMTGGFAAEPELDRSRRIEFGIERIFGGANGEAGSSSLEVSAFYDIISGHGLGVLALPLEASPETEAAFAEVARGVTAMQGAARGVRVMYARRFGEHVTAAAGYSIGRGSRLDDRFAPRDLAELTPSRLIRQGYFQVATAKLDLDFSERTGTRISTVVRLSPDAVIFAIDPFAGRLSVYDPNINIYVTQDLPSFGLPVKWQAMVDIRNLLNQLGGVDDGVLQLVAARNFRTVRGGVAFRW